MTRPSRDIRMLAVALETAKGSTCARRTVGCILVDARGKVLATGYNGPASGLPHCNEGSPCPGASLPSGEGLDLCEAIHAEQNALLQCADVRQIDTCYCTCSPCVTCVKLLLNTSCRRIVFLDEYPHEAARRLWEGPYARREWVQMSPAADDPLTLDVLQRQREDIEAWLYRPAKDE